MTKHIHIHVGNKIKDSSPLVRDAERALKNAINELSILNQVLTSRDDKSQVQQAKRLVEQALGKVQQEVFEK